MFTSLVIIFIGGPSGAGKSEVAKYLADKLDAAYVQMDSFYNTKSEMDEIKLDNWDDPLAFNWERFNDFLEQLESGYNPLITPDYVKEPGYIRGLQLIPRKETVIIDGMYALSDKINVSNGKTLEIYVDADKDKRRKRKIERDSKIGRTKEQVAKYFDEQTSVMEVEYVFPTKEKRGVYVVENNGYGIESALRDAYKLVKSCCV